MQRFPDIGPDDPIVLAIAAVISEELAAEAAAGFATLTRIPSSGVIQGLDYLETLGAAERQSLFDAQAQLIALHFLPPPLIAPAYEELRTTKPALLRRAAAMNAPAFAYGLRYLGLRMHRATMNDPQSVAMMAQTRAGLDFTPRDDLPPPLVGDTPIRDVETARAPLLRKLLNQVMRQRLSARPDKRIGGELIYEGTIDAVPLRVSIIFSNLYAQMVYGVSWSMPERRRAAHRLTYEALFGMGSGWDYLTVDNAAPSIDLLGGLLARLAALLHRIAALPTPD